ncbi:MAG: SPOR domain-containing protein [Azovibrio sp.]|uniref:SPOR domain-containing protein n=1 Tax=Azovibrio sp. TaxID=1872673 RepID=UPI003C785CA6
MIDPDDVQLQIKKKARRRLVGAVAFAAFAALVLPMVMDQEPAPPAQELEIRIPGQDGKPFHPSLAAVPPAPQEAPAAPPSTAVEVVPPTPESTPPAPAAQPVSKMIEKVPAKPESKPESRPGKPDEAERAAAILAGKTTAPGNTASAASGGPHVILIGAFTNEANVKNIKTKLGELGIKVYTEPLDSPQGRKTRVRAGPFPNRAAAEQALEKMKRIGVSGVVAARQ